MRPDWDNYFIEIAKVVSSRATCLRRKYGAVIVKDRVIISTGYNGSPRGMENCIDIGTCAREELKIPSGERYELCEAVHAEQNAICQAAKRGISIKGATIYTRMTPCRTCAMLLINCGIQRVVCERKYQLAEESEQLFVEASIQLVYKYGMQQEY